MVHPNIYPLLALALVGLEKAKTLFIGRLAAHCAALSLAIGAAAALHLNHPNLEILLAVAAIAAEFGALCLHHWALELHSRGRHIMRRVMLLDALDPDEGASALERAKHHCSVALRAKAVALEERDLKEPDKSKRRLLNYYWSPKDPGPERLRDHLFESAIFSKHLYSFAWKFSLVCLVILTGGAAVVITVLIVHHMAAAPEGPALAASLVMRVLIALVAFLPACQELDHLLLYRMVEKQLGDLLERVEATYAAPLVGGRADCRLLAEFGDYCAATTFAPPIRTVVYYLLVQRLQVEFEAKMKALGQGEGAASPLV